MEGDDRGLLPILQPEITRNGGVVLVGSSSRRLQRLNLLRAIASHPIKSNTERPVRLAQYRVNWTTKSRVAWGTHRLFRAPQVLFLA